MDFSPVFTIVNQRLFAAVKGVPRNAIPRRIQYLLRLLDIEEFANVAAKKLSGGTKRKLQFAIANVAAPEVLFLDEPSTGLDPASKRFLWSIIEANASEQAIVLTSHSLEEIEHLSSRIGIMVLGQLLALGTAARLRSKFGRGFQLEVRTKVDNVAALRAHLDEVFGDVVELSSFYGTSRYRILHRDARRMSLADVFALLEEHRQEWGIDDYAVSQTTLEQVFLQFAKLQDDEN